MDVAIVLLLRDGNGITYRRHCHWNTLTGAYSIGSSVTAVCKNFGFVEISALRGHLSGEATRLCGGAA